MVACQSRGTDIAQSFQGIPGSVPENTVRNHRLAFEWDLGFRCGIGTVFESNKWDLSADFTWFRTHHSKTATSAGGQFLIPLNAIPPLFASFVKTDWKIHFYTLDLKLGQSYFISPKLSFHPCAGIQSAWISQHIHTKSALIPPFAGQLNIRGENGFFGIGPLLSMQGKWFIASGLHFLAEGAGSLLWGAFTVRQGQTGSSHLHLDTHQVVPAAQLKLGIGYETNIYHNKYRIACSAAFENQYFWNQNQLPRFSFFPFERFERFSEDLSLQGLTVNATFDF